MQTYSTFQPTGFDAKGLNADRLERGHWLVGPVGRNRDSDTLDRSNWDVLLRELGGESNTVEVHRFGHWACGWFEIILIDPADDAKVTIAEECENSLADYPILDESHHSELEWNETAEYWARMSTRERVEYLQRAELSVFAARRDELPQDDNGRLFELLTRV